MDTDKVKKFYPCGVVHRSLYVGPNGAVTPSMSMCGAEVESRFPNIFQTPLAEILTDSSYTHMTEKKVKHILEYVDECRECTYRLRCCGGCRAQATGQSCADYYGKDPIICEMFKGGWVEKVTRYAAEIFGEDKQMNRPKSDCD